MGPPEKMDAVAIDLKHGPLKGYVGGKRTGATLIVYSLTGMGTVPACGEEVLVRKKRPPEARHGDRTGHDGDHYRTRNADHRIGGLPLRQYDAAAMTPHARDADHGIGGPRSLPCSKSASP
jgi:hypothetical protein